MNMQEKGIYKLYNVILESAGKGRGLQQKNGAMPSGHNGPYYDDETPVRNTSHWLITFRKAYEISGGQKFQMAAQKAAEYILSDEARPMGYTFWHRKNPEKDTCNGLIGQAWTIEALVEAAELLDSRESIRVAEEVFRLHRFREDLGLWRRTAVDGQRLPLDYTLNHQIWFAAAGALLAPYAESSIGRQIDRFLDRLHLHFRIHTSGLIKHKILTAYSWETSSWRTIFKRGIRRGVEVFFPSVSETKEVGYHAFNLYGLALLYRKYPDHSFWNSASFRKACTYLRSKDFRTQIYESPYGFPYNPPGFEVAFALDTFTDVFLGDTKEEKESWVQEQLDTCYDWKINLMRKNTRDEYTQSARLYESSRLNNISVRLK